MGEMNEQVVKRMLEKKLKEVGEELNERLDYMFQELTKSVIEAVTKKEVKEKSSKVDESEDTISAMLIKEGESNDEVQGHKELNEEEVKRILEKKVKEIEEELMKIMKESFKVDESETEDVISALLIKERDQSNDEVQEEEKELIVGLRDLSLDGSTINGERRIEELCVNPFNDACNDDTLPSEVQDNHDVEPEVGLRRSSTRPKFKNKKYFNESYVSSFF